MNKQTLWGSIALASTLAITGCNDSGSDSDSSTGPTDPKPPTGSTEVNFTLLQTTDLHHHAETYAKLATEINRIKKESENPVVLVDSGDFVMGSVYDMTLTTSPTNGNNPPAAFQFLNDVQYDVVTLGNHEFDYGDKALARWLDNSVGENFPHIVATNMVATGSPAITKHINGEASTTIRQTYTQTLFKDTDKEITIGFVGLMGPKSVTTITNAPAISFNNDKDKGFPAIQAQVDELRNSKNVDLVIALSHSGLDKTDHTTPAGDDVEYAKKIKGIDIIATGHAHTLVTPSSEQKPIIITRDDQSKTYIFGGGAYGEFLAQLDITFTTGLGVTDVKLNNHDIKKVDEDADDNKVQTIKQHVINAKNRVQELANINDIYEIVAKRTNPEFKEQKELGESSLGNLLADATRYSYKAYSQQQDGENGYTIEDTPVSLVANGVIRSDFSKSADITFSTMYDTLSLGLSIDKDQQNLTGSPLFTAYLTAQELENVAGLIGLGLASQDQNYMQQLAVLADQVPVKKDIVAAGINITAILNEVLAGNPLDLKTLLESEHINLVALAKRLKDIGINAIGILADKELHNKITNGEELQIVLEYMIQKEYIKPDLLLPALKAANLTIVDIFKLINGGFSLNSETFDTVLALIDLLEPPVGEIKTSDKVLATIKLVILGKIQPEWYLNASGLRATFDNHYEVAKVELYQKDDTHSQGTTALTELFDEDMQDTKTLYPVIADQYMLLLMYGPDFSLLRSLPGFAINPKTKDGKVIEFDINKLETHKNLLDMAIRSEGNEVKAWQALHTFFKAQANGNDFYQIPDQPYSKEAMTKGDSSRVNRSAAQ